MIEQIVSSSKDSFLKKVGKKAVTKAVETFVGEGVKAVVELWKTRHMKELDMEFEERERARKEDAADATSAKGSSDGKKEAEEDAEEAEEDAEEADDADNARW